MGGAMTIEPTTTSSTTAVTTTIVDIIRVPKMDATDLDPKKPAPALALVENKTEGSTVMSRVLDDEIPF